MPPTDGKFQIKLPGGGSCECSLRISRRCKHASLRLGALRGLELVTPPKYPLKRALDFASGNAAWIERLLKKKALQHQTEQQERQDAVPEPPLPSMLDLKACGESFQIDYINSPELGFVSARIESPGRLTVQGDLQDVATCRAAIIGWLRRRAERVFLPCAKDAAAECGLDFKALRIRNQKGRWGSCSRTGNVNLNFRLLLLEPRFLRHVLIHELCHRAEQNHSTRFWKIVERFDPDAKATAKELNKAAAALPSWLRL